MGFSWLESILYGLISGLTDILPISAQVHKLILQKMLGISYLSEFASSLCKDSGYSSLAGQIEFFGRISILSLSMPVVFSLLETLGQLLI